MLDSKFGIVSIKLLPGENTNKYLLVVISTSAALAIDLAGRRPLWLISTLGMMFSFCIVMGLSARYAQDSSNKPVGTAVIPFLFIFFGFYDVAWTPLAYS
jgi:uncharacterized membrane protein